jgi:nitrogenase molybdenum-iron protein alpha/beta subunit
MMVMQLPGRVEPLLGCRIAGILQAVSGIERVVPIVHGPMSCASGHRIIPLYANKEPLVASTSLTEMDIIMGTEDRLKEAIFKAEEIYHPDLIIVILTCATSLTGEISKTVVNSVAEKIHCPVIVEDGSGIVGDEISGFRSFYMQFRDLVSPMEQGGSQSEDCELAGISPSDFNCSNDIIAINKLLDKALNINVRRSLFYDTKLDKHDWIHYRTLNIGRLWLDTAYPIPAPFGVNGTQAWINNVANQFEKNIQDNFLEDVKSAKAFVEHKRKTGIFTNLRVGIEAYSWWGIGLARFLSDELGCEVFLTSDIGAQIYQTQFGRIAATVTDIGNTELVEQFRSFQANIVFGSSYSKTNDWAWIPFWQPVWHVIDDPSSMMGIDGAIKLVELLETAA